MTPINVGIIGQGRSGHNIHAMTLSSLPELYKIAAVSDPEESYRRRAVQKFGCDAYENHKDFLDRKDLDLIVNASPSHMHVPLTLEFLEHGFHVLCEKPLARTVEDVDLLIEASIKAGKLLAIFQQSRFSPAFQQIIRIVDSGVLGRIIQVKISFNGFSRRWDWQTLQENNGGNLLNTGPHPLDQALQLFGAEAMPEITCMMDRVNTYGDAEDFVKLILKKQGYPLLDIEISSCDAFPQASYQLQAQYGGISGSDQKLNWSFFAPEQAPKQSLIRIPLKNADGSPSYGSEVLPWVEEQWEISEEQADIPSYMCKTFYKKLFSSIVDGTPLEITPQQVRRQIAIIEECHRQNPLSRLRTGETK